MSLVFIVSSLWFCMHLYMCMCSGHGYTTVEALWSQKLSHGSEQIIIWERERERERERARSWSLFQVVQSVWGLVLSCCWRAQFLLTNARCFYHANGMPPLQLFRVQVSIDGSIVQNQLIVNYPLTILSNAEYYLVFKMQILQNFRLTFVYFVLFIHHFSS